MISIAMTTYNGEKYLREQIDSILSQTIQDFELIVCDDCSTDTTWGILEDYAKRDNRFHIYENQENIGFLKNFEKAIELCQGDYIALSDQDDIWTENHLEVLLNTIGDKVLACGNSLLVDENGNSMGMTLKEQESLDYIPKNDFKKLMSILLFRNPYQGSSMMFKRELKEKILPFPESINFHDTWIASVACLEGGINYMNKIVLYYRRTGANITSKRQKRRPKFKRFIHRELFVDRIFYISCLLDRIPELSSRKMKKLLYVRDIIENNTRKRWLPTLFFLFTHYKSIYSADFLHLR